MKNESNKEKSYRSLRKQNEWNRTTDVCGNGTMNLLVLVLCIGL